MVDNTDQVFDAPFPAYTRRTARDIVVPGWVDNPLFTQSNMQVRGPRGPYSSVYTLTIGRAGVGEQTVCTQIDHACSRMLCECVRKLCFRLTPMRPRRGNA